MEKKSIYVKVSVHWIKAAIIEGLNEGTIDLSKDTLRSIGEKIGLKECAPQKIKSHLEQLVNMGAVQKINGQYSYEVQK